jgi:hypothetical protein
MEAFYDEKPKVYEAVGNGSYLYRWKIKEVKTSSTSNDGEEVTRTQWQCQEVTVWSPVTSNKVVKAVFGELWDNDHEQKLINEYYSAQMGLYDEETKAKAEAAYKTFLTERAALKEQVEKDCKDCGIE